MPSFVVTLAGLLFWQGVILYTIGDQGVIVIDDSLINNVANYFFSDTAGYLIAAIATGLFVIATLAGVISRRRHGILTDNLVLVVAKIVGLAAIAFGVVYWANEERGFPVAFLLVIVLLVFWTWVAERTTFGRHVYAVGGNAEAARRAGINVRNIRMIVFMISGAMAGLGGVIFASRLNSVDLNAGGGTILLDAIAAAVIGGTSLFGGRGRVISALMGVAGDRDARERDRPRRVELGDQVHGHGRDSARRGHARHAAAPQAPAGRQVVRTSLGIWALGPMVTRFVPGGYQPEHAGETTVQRVRRAVDGLGDLIDDYEFHYPGELHPDNLDEVRDALDGHGIYTICTGLHLDPRFGRGGLVSPDPAVRAEARRLTRETAELAGEVGANMVCWPGIEGYNYPFQTPYAESWEWFIEGIAEAAETCEAKGVKLFLEHKNSEPAMKILMRNIGMTLHVIHTLRARGITNVQVNMDWQHLLMNGESLAEYAALLAAEGLLGHQHANSGWGTFDDDNMVGATAFMETLELAVELRRARYGEHGERLGFDLYPYTEDAVAAVARSVEQWRFIWDVSGRIDDAALREAQSRKDAIRAYELVYAALGA